MEEIMKVIQVPSGDLPEHLDWAVVQNAERTQIYALVSAAAMVTDSERILAECYRAARDLLADSP